MPHATDLILLRHTAVGVETGLCYGRTDVPLAPEAERDIARAVRALPGKVRAYAQVVSSPASRCLQLAQALAAQPAVDARLAEFDFGVWERRSWSQLPRVEVALWAANVSHVRVPGGETLHEVAARARQAVQAHKPADGAPLLLVTHGGVIRALLATLLPMALHDAGRLHIAHGRPTCLRLHRTHAELRYLNR